MEAADNPKVIMTKRKVTLLIIIALSLLERVERTDILIGYVLVSDKQGYIK